MAGSAETELRRLFGCGVVKSQNYLQVASPLSASYHYNNDIVPALWRVESLIPILYSYAYIRFKMTVTRTQAGKTPKFV